MIKKAEEHVLITCILPKGKGIEMLYGLHAKGIVRADVHSARGFVGSGSADVFARVEKDILSVIASSELADEVFEWVYREAEIGEVYGSFLWVMKLSHATPFSLPEEIPREEI